MDRLERIKTRLFEDYYEKKEWWGDDLSVFDQEGVSIGNPSGAITTPITRKSSRGESIRSFMKPETSWQRPPRMTKRRKTGTGPS
jgi:hypothetical protein